MVGNSLKRVGIWAAWFAAAFLTFGPSIGSRNGSGTFTTPNTFVAGTTITAAAFNQNFSDIASELTNSVAADGQTSMTGPLKASNGSPGSPSFTFASDTDTGMYRFAANEIGFAVNGGDVAKISIAGVDASFGKIREIGNPLIPAGTMVDYAGGFEPAGWLYCNGQAVSRTVYYDLFAAIDVQYGVGDGSTTFNVPDLRGRVTAGGDSMGGVAAAGRLTGIDFKNTTGSQSHVISTAEMPTHDHTVSGTTGDESNTHTHHYGSAAIGNTGPTAGNLITTGTANTTDANNTGHTHTFSATTSANGSSTAMTLVQPTMGMNKIIKW